MKSLWLMIVLKTERIIDIIQRTDVAKKFFTHKGKDVNLKIVEYPINKGKGGAVRTVTSLH